MTDLAVNIAGVTWKNPVTCASGTFGSGEEYAEFVDIERLGAVTTKGVSAVPWEGNDSPRVAETYGGMINSVGLQNPGIGHFCERDIPFLRKYDTKIIVNVCGKTVEEYREVACRLASEDVDMLEINISCPNVSEGGMAFGTDPGQAALVTRAVKKVARQPVIMKLSPNAPDIVEIAKAVEEAGADAVSLINTVLAMKIDVRRREFALSRPMGGLSGPAIHPIAVRMVYQVARAVKIPIIGMGGILTPDDAVEMILAGASAVSVGTANFHDPSAAVHIIDGIEEYMREEGFHSVKEMTGAVRENTRGHG